MELSISTDFIQGGGPMDTENAKTVTLSNTHLLRYPT